MESKLSIDFNQGSSVLPFIRFDAMKYVTSVLLLVLACFVSPLCAQDRQENDSARLKAQAKTLVEMLIAEEFTEVRQQFSEKLKLELSAEKLLEGWTNFKQHVGSFKRQIDSQAGKRNGLPEVIVKCEFSKSQGYVQIGYDAEKKIVGLWIAPLLQSDTSTESRESPAQDQPEANRFKSLANAVADMLVKENFAAIREQFNTDMRNRFSEEQLRSQWVAFKLNVGAFKNQLKSEYKREGGLDVVSVRCQFDRAVIQINVAYDTEMKINGLWFFPAQ